MLIPSPYKETFSQPVTWAKQWNSGQSHPGTEDEAKGEFGTAFVPYRAGYDPKTGLAALWGPEVAFLYHRHRVSLPAIYFVKYAIGGTSVYLTQPGAENWNIAATGTDSLANALTVRIKRAADNLLAQGYTRVNVRILWGQGESDAGSWGMTYRQNFNATYKSIVAKLNSSTVTVQLATMTLVANASWRNAQAQINIAATDNKAQVVNVHDYPVEQFISDNLHLGPEGQIRQGREMELLFRTRPRVVIDNTATDITALTVTVPVRPTAIVNLASVADGRLGWEMTGVTTGLSLDPLLGKLSVSDPALVKPGVRTLVIKRHSAADVRWSKLVITFVP